MNISPFSSSLPQISALNRQTNPNRSGFADLMTAADKGQSAGNLRLTNANRQTASSTPDFRNMTSTEFKDQAQAMYDSGQIDITTLGVMQLSANVPDTDGSPATRSFDFTSIIKSKMDFEVESGHKNNPISSYKIYAEILGKISRVDGVNRVG